LTPDGSLSIDDLALSDDALHALPQARAVFQITAGAGRPYIAKTSVLRRRALRLLARREHASRLLNLRDTFTRLDYWLTGSALEASLQQYELVRRQFPDEYLRMLRLRMPFFVKLILGNPWPRTMVTAHAGGNTSLVYGPFRSRVSAEAFESGYLDLFQIRRCQEDLAPSPEHPGCIFGEMNKCSRPCQTAVSPDEYAQEVARAAEFLRTTGRSLIRGISAARDTLSAEMEFEEAARQHRRLEKVEEALRLRDELAGDVDRLNACAVTRSAVENTADLFLLREGHWQGKQRIGFELEDGKPVSIDRKLRELFAATTSTKLPPVARREHLAILARWFYSTWRDGELLVFEKFDDPPVRKLVNAIGRVMERSSALTG
jgi:excinuclease UvrABC nuclease subunit